MIFRVLRKTDCQRKWRWQDKKSPTNSMSIKELLVNNGLEIPSSPGITTAKGLSTNVQSLT